MALRPASLFTVVRLALVALAVTACASSGGFLGPSASTTTLMAGWERHFAVDWTTESERGGTHRLVGYVTGRQGAYAEPVRLLAQALDSSGAVVAQRIRWVPGGVNGFQRAYFDIPDLPSAAQYRVTVWDYTFQQSGDSGWL
ncbi:MAG: hypothetical protein DME04_21575 [Candidatus Rokuibacteriota bacterium]|nr:MAG: hypothetical protein DME04_21575 [Candidatus Rokubacteria bacterium]